MIYKLKEAECEKYILDYLDGTPIKYDCKTKKEDENCKEQINENENFKNVNIVQIYISK